MVGTRAMSSPARCQALHWAANSWGFVNICISRYCDIVCEGSFIHARQQLVKKDLGKSRNVSGVGGLTLGVAVGITTDGGIHAETVLSGQTGHLLCNLCSAQRLAADPLHQGS